MLTIDFLKGYIKDVPDIEDDLIQLLLDAAVSRFETETNMKLMPLACKQDFSGWWDPILIECFPVTAITKVGYTDGDGELQEVDGSNYTKQLNKGFPEISLSISAPTLNDIPYPVTVEFTAGYATADDIPKDIKLCLAQMITSNYERREDPVQKLPTAVSLTIQKYRKYSL